MQQIFSTVEKILKGEIKVTEFAALSDIPTTTMYSWIRQFKKNGTHPDVSFVDADKIYRALNPGKSLIDGATNYSTVDVALAKDLEQIETDLAAVNDAAKRISDTLKKAQQAVLDSANQKARKDIEDAKNKRDRGKKE